MSSLKAALVIFAIIYCDSQVQSNPRTLSTVYYYTNYNLIIGKNHIHKTSLVYALCTSENFAQEVNCQVILDAGPFDSSTPARECPLHLKSQSDEEQIEVLGVDLMGNGAVIFSWRQTSDESSSTRVIIQTIQMTRNCASSAQIFSARTPRDMIPQVFIIPGHYRYQFGYVDTVRYTNFFETISVDERNVQYQEKVLTLDRSFVLSWESIENSANKFLITIGNNGPVGGSARFYVSSFTAGETELARARNVHNFGWDTSNGFISLCSADSCWMYGSNGQEISLKRLIMDRIPTKYAALYNLPDMRHLAMVCDDQENSDYRVIKIGSYGEEEYTYTIRDLKCAHTYEYFTAKFYTKSDTEYCLSLFHSDPTSAGKVKFHSYCFYLPN